MTGSGSKRLSLILATAMLMSLAATTLPAGANHGTDVAGVLEQAGNGRGANSPLLGLGGVEAAGATPASYNLGSVIFNLSRFTQGRPRTGYPRYLGWGTERQADGTGRLVRLNGGDDGLRWDSPAPAFIRDPSGVDVPLLIAENSSFDVTYTNFIDLSNFVLFYMPVGADRYATSISAIDIESIPAIHAAFSEDGVNWFADNAIAQDTGGRLITGSASVGPQRGTNGPTDIIFQPGTTTNLPCTTTAPSWPWNCRWVLVYDAIGALPSETRGLAIAGTNSFFLDTQQFEFRAQSSLILAPGAAGTWDDQNATLGHVRYQPPTFPPPPNPSLPARNFQLYYSGSQASGSSSVGVATSSSGVAFTRVNPLTPGGPSISSTLLDPFGSGTASLLTPMAIDDNNGSGHAKVFFTRQGSGSTPVYSSFLAYTAPLPPTGPQVRVAQPTAGLRNTAATPVEIYVNDSSAPLFDPLFHPGQFSATFDGNPVNGLSFSRTLIGATIQPGLKLVASGANNVLSEGAHTLVVTVTDTASAVGTATVLFGIDTKPPSTILTSVPPSPQIGYPDSIGTFEGTTVDPGGLIARIRATVTNPLGQKRSYESTAAYSWTLNGDQGGNNYVPATTVNWRFVAPVSAAPFNTVSPDVFYLVPGDYMVSFAGIDQPGNVEKAGPPNTTTVFVL